MDSSSSEESPGNRNRRKFLRRVFSTAIEGQTCPICLKLIEYDRAAVLTDCGHAYCVECICKWSDVKRTCPLCNAAFDSWFCKIDPSSGRFIKQQLPSSSRGKRVVPEARSSSRYGRRIIGRSREELNCVKQRTRSLPWRRSFGRPGFLPSHVIAERKLQWRASVYKQGLQAIPMTLGNRPQLDVWRDSCEKDKLLQRTKPWIWRELEAVLGDPDPSIIVHVVSSLFISRLEAKHNVSSRELNQEDDFLAPLRPFLHDWTNNFWHELRCFAESPFNMETYDAVVEYRQLS